MNQSEFNNLTGVDFRGMSKKELKSIIQQQAKSANSRYQNIKGRSDTSKEATSKVDRSGGRFSVQGKTTHKALVEEAKRIQNFNREPTSNIRGAVQAAEQIEKTYNEGKSIKQSVREYIKGEKKRVTSEKGKRLSKKQRERIERVGKKLKKELQEKVKKSWQDFTKGDFEPGDAGEDFKEETPQKSPIDEEGKSFEQMQEEYYTNQKAEDESPLVNVNDQTDEDSVFI